jgi:Arylsulfotransferase (ASST)
MERITRLGSAIIIACLLILATVASLRADGPPVVTVVNPHGITPAPGSIFLATLPVGIITDNYRLILGADGALIRSDIVSPTGATANDYKSNGGTGLPITSQAGQCIGLFDLSISQTGQFCPAGDYTADQADFHDFQLDRHGNGWLLIYHNEPTDLSPWAGYTTATIELPIIQQISAITGGVLWQIKQSDWLTISDVAPTIPLTGTFAQPYHANSVALCDNETTVLVSSRNVDEVVKIRLSDNAILWRLGGKNATVVPSDGIGIEFQHDARCADDGNLISVFDDGDQARRDYSRAVVYQVNPSAGIAELIYEYRHTPDLHARFTGNFQYWPEIDRGFIHWGSAAYDDPDAPNVTEVRLSDGAVVQELFLPAATISYRITKGRYHPERRYLPLVARGVSSE